MAINNNNLIEYITIPPKGQTGTKETYQISDITWRTSPLRNVTRGDIARWNSKIGNYIEESRIGQRNGVAPLNSSGKIDSTFLSLSEADGIVPLNGEGKIDSSYLPTTITQITPGVGLTTADGQPITNTGTLKLKLKTESAATNDSTTITNTTDRQYAVVLDNSGYLSVNVPWTDTIGEGGGSSLTYTAGTGLTLNGTTFKVKLNNETSLGTIGTTQNLFPIGIDSNGQLCVLVTGAGGGGTASYNDGNLDIS